MHFGKTYKELLSSLPPELREDAIEYRQLKKLIRKVVNELAVLGLSPDVLHRVLQATTSGKLTRASLIDSEPSSAKGKEKARDTYGPPPAELAELAELERVLDAGGGKLEIVQVLYELDVKEDLIEPRLRVRIGPPPTEEPSSSAAAVTPSDVSTPDTLHDLASENDDHPITSPDNVGSPPPSLNEYMTPTWTHEYIVPLASDSAFYELLSTALQALSARLQAVRSEFVASLDPLARNIAHGARPMSTTDASFQPHSHNTNPSDIRVTSGSGARSLTRFGHGAGIKSSDLYAWREIFQMYMDAEIFQSSGERDRGDRSIEETEKRLNMFVERLNQANFGDGKRLALKESKGALQDFLQMNLFLLNIKKLQYANTEAMRKILKKHAKRTALPSPDLMQPSAPSMDPAKGDAALVPIRPLDAFVLFPATATSLPRLLVQAVGEILLPIIPAVDDYACLICTSIAFKPIRLTCGHLFCVRCLVKMQKKNKANCPMCRAPTVLTADRTNVDWALLNFMKDWFPVEAKVKLKQNEAEAAREELQELGFSADTPGCVVA